MIARIIGISALSIGLLGGCSSFPGEQLSKDDPYLNLPHFKAQAISPQGTALIGGPAGAPELAVEDALALCEELLEGPCKLTFVGERRVNEPSAEELKTILTNYEAWMEDQARVSADSGNPQAANWLAYYYATRGKHLDRAVTYAQTALKAAPEAPAALDTMGLVLYRMGNTKQAEPYFIKAAQGDPSAEHIKHYADNAMAMGKLSFAEKAYERALTANPTPMLRRRIDQRLHRIRQKTGRARR